MRVNVYIRKENEARWDSITDKSEWINAYLSKSPPNSVVVEKDLEPVPYLKTKLCKNGHLVDDNGYCFGKGCKYAR